MDYYIGEIRSFPYTRVPNGWIPCNGQILQIQQYAALYSLVSNRYGGNGTTTFAVPDLRSRVIIGLAYTAPYNVIGTPGGVENVQLTIAQIPPHVHTATVSSQVSSTNLVSGTTPASTPSVALLTNESVNIYAPATLPTVTLAAGTLSQSGGSAGHSNIMPYNTLQVCICVSGGIYPMRN